MCRTQRMSLSRIVICNDLGDIFLVVVKECVIYFDCIYLKNNNLNSSLSEISVNGSLETAYETRSERCGVWYM